ncbi:MAG: cztS [Chthonomonadaceae bacterium]|nr:cztS [Chthonomonadaceae bacterium]
MPSDNLFARVSDRLAHRLTAIRACARNRRIWCRSLRFRLTVWYGSLLALALTVAAIGLYTAACKFFQNRQDSILALNTYYLVKIAETGSPGHSDAAQIMQSRNARTGLADYSLSVKQGFHGFSPMGGKLLAYVVYVRIVDMQSKAPLALSDTLRARPDVERSLGEMLLHAKGSSPLQTFSAFDDDDKELPAPGPTSCCTTPLQTFSAIDDKGLIRAHTETLMLDGRATLLQTAVSLEYPEEMLEHVALVFCIGVPAIVVLAMLGGWMLVNRTLQPIGRIATQARLLDANALPTQLLAPPQETDSELGQLVTTLNDMTTRLHEAFEAQRRYAEAKAQFAGMQQTFVADASHELRTPLTILRGEIELAMARPRRLEDYRSTMTSALEEIGRMGRIVDGLTLLARGDAGALVSQDHFEDVDLLDIAYSVVGDFKKQAMEQRIALTLQQRDGLSPTMVVRGDPGQLRQLLCNLLDNALKYTMQQGCVTVSVAMQEPAAIGEERRQRWMTITVSDTGIGIADEDLLQIFERFWRADRSRATGGSGLGLAICAQIVEAHGGTIAVESRLGEGSCFRITLPFTDNGARLEQSEEMSTARQVRVGDRHL